MSRKKWINNQDLESSIILKNHNHHKRIWIKFVIMGLMTIIAYTTSMNWFQLLLVQGNSMYPTIRNMQVVILDKRVTEYEIGDVVAFWCDDLSAVLVKRIVAGPHDSVQVVNSHLYVNSRKLPSFQEKEITDAGMLKENLDLKEGEYVVIGDNVADSIDSRNERVGVVKQSDFLGKIF